MERIRRTFQALNWQKLAWVLALEIVALQVATAFFFPYGDDLYRFYRPFAEGCLPCGFVPYFAQWALAPLAWLPPYPLTWPLWSALSLGGYLVLCRVTGVNPALFIISFPLLAQFWLGQIDVLICLGLVLMVFAPNAYLRGTGLIFALVKPQITVVAILVWWLQQPRRDYLKLALVPAMVLGASFLVFGWAWPLAWLQNALQQLPVHGWRLAALDSWRYGIWFIWLPVLFRNPRARFEASLLIATLATPYFGIYSYLVFLIFRLPWWSVLVSYVWLVAYPFWQIPAMRLAWILPVALLAHLLYQEWRHKRLLMDAELRNPC